MSEALRRELLELAADDTATRERLAKAGVLWNGYHPEMEAVHRRNAERLRALLDAHGWPGRSVVGPEAAEAAFIVLVHAIGEPAFMRDGLALLRAAVERGEADPKHLAVLEDRIRVNEGRPQLYGTQWDWTPAGDAMVPMVGVEDPERVDERRRSVGLPPMQWRRPPPPDERPPPNLADRARELDDWARKTGWR